MPRFLFVVILIVFQVGTLLNAQQPAVTDYEAVARSINDLMRAHHYDPVELDGPEYRRMEEALVSLGASVQSDDAFLDGFREMWQDGPFSHVSLNRAQGTADEMAAFFDSMEIGGGGAVLSWRNDDAILTVNTMMGLDTIEEIDAAYAALVERNARSLIIDLRENGGGAFAVRPLVGHLISEPFDAGGFVSQYWNSTENRDPDLADFQAVDPWEGWSIIAFWQDVVASPITRVRFDPIDPIFTGPVYLQISERTASAAELAADALGASGRAILIGETSAGQMLSQKIFDVTGGFHLSLPIADYYSAFSGRIEGVGVQPDIVVDAHEALGVALSH